VERRYPQAPGHATGNALKFDYYKVANFFMAKPIKKTGTFQGKSNKLGHGGRAAQLKARGVPQAVIGMIARAKGAAPGGPNFHGKRK
jgi:hypothetical protein